MEKRKGIKFTYFSLQLQLLHKEEWKVQTKVPNLCFSGAHQLCALRRAAPLWPMWSSGLHQGHAQEAQGEGPRREGMYFYYVC